MTQPSGLGQTAEFSLPYTLTTGPFAGLEVPNATASANAAHIHQSLIDTYLITHPHLDHICGFVINTAGPPGSRPKRLAGLPSTIAAFKTHIFNNVIWPNLSDENNGAGLVTYMRLVEGGSPALGEGEGRGYLEICDGLAVKIWGVSHGHCIERHSHRGSGSGARHGSFDASSMGPMGVGMASSPLSPRALALHNSANPSLGPFLQQQQQQRESMGGSMSQAGAGALSGGRRSSSVSGIGVLGQSTGESVCVYDSSAYFIRDVATGREILIFGDVEPDSISLSPRNQQVWQEAAPKIATGKLAAIFIECSYDDSQSDDRLFGHLAPRFIAEEMKVLAGEVSAAKQAILQEKSSSIAPDSQSSTLSDRKRKRGSVDEDQLLVMPRRKAATPTPQYGGGCGTISAPTRSTTVNYPAHLTPNRSPFPEDPVSPKTVKPLATSSATYGTGGVLGGVMNGSSGTGGNHVDYSPHLTGPTAELSLREFSSSADISNLNTTAMGAAPTPPLELTNGWTLRVGADGGNDEDENMNKEEEAEEKNVEEEEETEEVPPTLPLMGLKVVVIHVKDKLNDEPKAGDVILEELLAYEKRQSLGVEYVISEVGQSLHL
ncbi:low-affinity cAMP phosphodiesterase [Apodospora peruviana]|uniref:Low-affinity cAMP phosphodiesterase n=1 Tax=Apodospora peruviana TaxID=516989 RepID=A0AAE0M975_9PEZI|nr:low-affinity cAMP phosphodiesterase [Apodospora peruviana]